MLDTLGKAKYFTTLDLRIGHWKIPCNEEDKEKTTFTCNRGLYEWNISRIHVDSLAWFKRFIYGFLDDINIICASKE